MDARLLRQILQQYCDSSLRRRYLDLAVTTVHTAGIPGLLLALAGKLVETGRRLKDRRTGCFPFSDSFAPERRILFIEARMIAPDQDSGSERLSRVMNLVHRLGYEVGFVPGDLGFNARSLERLRSRGIFVPRPDQMPSVETFLAWYGRCFGAVVLSRADLTDWLYPLVRNYLPDTLLVFDTVDLHFLREQRAADLLRDPRQGEAARKRRDQELRLVEQADVTWVVSPTELDILNELTPQAEVRVVSNIHTVHSVNNPFAARNGILFVGGFEHAPNVDAVTYYAREILPRLERLLPGVVTHIVGSRPPVEITRLASEALRVWGYVEDLGPFLEGCRLSIAPLRYGAGVKGKVNLSMSWGLPVVVTPSAAEGAHLTDGLNAMIAGDPEEFAEKTARLYRDPVLWQSLSENGKLNIQRYFSPEIAAAAILKTFERIGSNAYRPRS